MPSSSSSSSASSTASSSTASSTASTNSHTGKEDKIRHDKEQRKQHSHSEKEEGVACGEKFRNMLNCVEKTGDISSCTYAINTFLACERAVFHSALRANPTTSSPSPSTSHTHNTNNISTITKSKHFPPPDAPREGEQQTPSIPNDHPLSSASLSQLFVKAIDKQAKACTLMFQTVINPQNPARILDFSSRIVKDIGHSLSLISNKLVKQVKQLSNSDNDKSGK